MIQSDWLKSVSEGHNTSLEVDSAVLICSVQTMDTEEHFLYTKDQHGLQINLKLNIHQLTQLLVVH